MAVELPPFLQIALAAAGASEERHGPLGRFSSMNQRVDQYRRKALEMRQRAQSAHELGARLSYLELADQWEDLAVAAESLHSRA